jgi:hypothetical protein
MMVMQDNFELLITVVLVIGYIGCGAEPRKGTVRTVWEIFVIGCFVNLSKDYVFQIYSFLVDFKFQFHEVLSNT